MSTNITDISTNGRPDFWIRQEITADAVIIRVGGDLDHTTITQVDDELHAAETIPTPPALVVLDLSHVSFLGSDGLSLLLVNHRQCATRGRQLRVVATTHTVLRPIALTGLDGVLSIASTVHEAISAST